MKICICDDDCFTIREIRNLLLPFQTEEDGFDISDFSCSEDLIDYYKSGKGFDIVFIDIELKDINGIEAAEIIRTAANTDINTIFGAVINENLNDEVIVTVIATGFEQPSEPLYHSFNSTKKEDMYRESRSTIDIDNDLDIPPFLRDRDDF